MSGQMISSLQHAEVKLVKSLGRRKERMELGLFVIEGVRFVEEAEKAEAALEKVYYVDQILKTERGLALLHKLKKRGIALQEVSLPVMAKMADTEQPQGILATVKIPGTSMPAFGQTLPFVLICDKIQDPGNLGTIIRTADAAGVHAIFTTSGTVDVYNPKVLRATMGSIFHLPLCLDMEPEEILQVLHKYKLTSVAATLAATKWHFELNYNVPVALWLGNEGAGITEDVLALLNEQIKIPMPGRSESLNVAVAASVLMYECLRQRMAN